MATGKNTKFDIDLEYGQIREKRVADLLKGSKVEIKLREAGGERLVTLLLNMSIEINHLV